MEAAVRVIAQHGVRGLRVEQLAAEAGVSTALIYYHFKDRGGVLRAALEHVNQRAQDYTDQALSTTEEPRAQLENLLLLELRDETEVAMNSIAWGELRASAVFDPDLRDPLTATTRAWNDDVETLLARAGATAPALAAEHLTALVEGLSERWHTGSITLDRARAVLTHAIARELGD
ncbi:helix-turn-helix domain-containing protein [Nocardia sp. NPDC050717]|uniref:TetR/AcrR family transcriptional regulator n=1 Tax=Nocardia sp. NPDC050717 TaxID=3157221 RepID=UPI0033E5BB19